MMEAMISIKAGRAAYMKDETLFYVDIAKPDTLQNAAPAEFSAIFQNADDIEVQSVADFSESVADLQVRCFSNRACHLLQLATSPVAGRVRGIAARELDGLMSSMEFGLPYFYNIIFSVPNDGLAAVDLNEKSWDRADGTRQLIADLVRAQPRIRIAQDELSMAFQAMGVEIADAIKFRAVCVRAGLFRLLVQDRLDELDQLESYKLPIELTSIPRYHDLFNTWRTGLMLRSRDGASSPFRFGFGSKSLVRRGATETPEIESFWSHDVIDFNLLVSRAQGVYTEYIDAIIASLPEVFELRGKIVESKSNARIKEIEALRRELGRSQSELILNTLARLSNLNDQNEYKDILYSSLKNPDQLLFVRHALMEFPYITTRILAQISGVSLSQTAECLDNLHAVGLIERDAYSSRKVRHLRLSELGFNFLTVVANVRRDILSRALRLPKSSSQHLRS